MFKIDPNISEKDLKKKNIFKVLISMNSHQIATPETSLEDARSYVFFFREGKHKLSAYIGLHLLLTDRKLFYANSNNPFKEDQLSEVEDEARDFAEYLGAMLDEVNFAGMSDVEGDKWIDDQGIFSTKTRSVTVPETTPVTAPVSTPEAAPLAAPVKQAPAPEIAVVAPAPKPLAPSQQPAPAAEVKSVPEPPAAPVQPVPKPRPPEAKEQPHEAPVTETVKLDVQFQAPPIASTKHSREVAQKEATTGIEIPQKQTIKKKSFSATSVVSRDREALARLLTSF
jgi:hypothetical protein